MYCPSSIGFEGAIASFHWTNESLEGFHIQLKEWQAAGGE